MDRRGEGEGRKETSELTFGRRRRPILQEPKAKDSKAGFTVEEREKISVDRRYLELLKSIEEERTVGGVGTERKEVELDVGT